MKKIIIAGATSAIAASCARLWAADKAEFFLAARNSQKLKEVADDLTVRGASAVHMFEIDLSDNEKQQSMLDDCFAKLGSTDIALVCYGTLPDQEKCEQDAGYAAGEFANNGSSTINLLTLMANKMEKQGAGSIVVVSSVAADRGRRSNYLYGSAKAAVSTFCAGLRLRLMKSGVNLLVVKPGFVATPMTAHLDLPKALTVGPDRVARDIVNAIDKRRGRLYTPWYWFFIMLIIKHLPEPIFKRLPI